MTCTSCGQPVQAAVVPEQAMGTGDLVLRATGLRLVACPAGHREVRPSDVAERASSEVRSRLLEARPARLLGRHPRCGDCRTELVLPPRDTDTPVPMDLDGQVVTVVVEAAMARCPACGREQLLPGTGARVRPILEAVVTDVASR